MSSRSKKQQPSTDAAELALSVLGERLKEIRNLRGVTQTDLAALLNVGQTALAHSEARSDMRLSTLLDYVRALGGKVQLSAVFDDLGVVDLLGGGKGKEGGSAHLDQLQLPGLPLPPASAGRDVVLSIKPNYADQILSGRKTVELRRRFSGSVPKGALALIYSTTPTKALTGAALIDDVQRLPISELWRRHEIGACVPRSYFDRYFGGLDEGYAIVLNDPRPLKRPLELENLRVLCGFHPPQSYQYASPRMSGLFHDEWAKAPN